MSRARVLVALMLALVAFAPFPAFGQGQAPPGPAPTPPPGVTLDPRPYHGPTDGNRVSLDQVPGLTAQDRQRVQEAHNRARAQDPTLPSQPTLRRFQLPDAAHPGNPHPPAGGLRLQALTENAPLDQFSGSCGIGAYGQVAGYRLGYGQGLQNCSGATIQTVDLELMQCYWSVFGVCG